MSKTRLAPALVVAFVIVRGASDYTIFFGHLLAQFDGVVAARKDVRYPPWTRYHATRYTIRGSDGRERAYIADPTEGGTHGFAMGTHLEKQRWRMDYEENGRRVDDFPVALYGFWVIFNTGLGLGAIILAIMIRIRDRSSRDLAAAAARAERRLEAGDDLPP
jgi:hypothetical protein